MKQVFAQQLYVPGQEGGQYLISGIEAFKFARLSDVINAAVTYIFAFAGLGLLVMIISAGFSMLTSAGDAKKMEAGKHQLTNGLIGFFLIFAAYWIVQIVGYIFGIEGIKTLFPW